MKIINKNVDMNIDVLNTAYFVGGIWRKTETQKTLRL